MLRSFESEISKINEQKKVNPKKLSPEHARIIDELMEDHRYARKTTGMLVDAKERYLKGENTVEEVITLMKELARFYPVHIEKEDKHFFFPCQEYFSKEELDKMLAEFYEFDRKMIHEKYEKIVITMETQSL
ncbi:MAG: hypothetical protein CVU51_01660 [Deltaproteobacteria bacterium HGW-Deltaproteobacteria-1]|nr:MAG: hypothetical protein CVU51_01660 [Deltaproteobacteria bacterium HGW-Deltaproteobacteria-1]